MHVGCCLFLSSTFHYSPSPVHSLLYLRQRRTRSIALVCLSDVGVVVGDYPVDFEVGFEEELRFAAEEKRGDRFATSCLEHEAKDKSADPTITSPQREKYPSVA